MTTNTTKAAKTSRSRNLTVEGQMYLVRNVAFAIAKRLPRHVQEEDLIQDGVFGLMDALRRYDPEKSKFATFAVRRIRGAIFDALRDQDFYPRLTERRRKLLETATDDLSNELGRPPSHDELIGRLDRPDAEKIISEGRIAFCNSLSYTIGGFDRHNKGGNYEKTTVGEIIEDRTAPRPIQVPLAKDLREMMERGLDHNQRFILRARFIEGLTMKEVGAAIGLSESRVSQMTSHLLTLLRGRQNLRDEAGIPAGPFQILDATDIRHAVHGQYKRKRPWTGRDQGWTRPDRQGRRRMEAAGKKSGQAGPKPIQEEKPRHRSPLTLNPAPKCQKGPQARRSA